MSTVGLLLPRFYDVSSGAVTIDGTDVRDVTFDSLRRQIGVVFEDAFLFSDTVRANIAYGRPDATDDEVAAAARAAEADRFIADLPEGYDTVVGERGVLLSGGQRQRLTLARALLTDPRILILDDATSSIDSRVEAEIHETLRHLMIGRTTILVAHRRSTLRLADRIVVLDAGRIVDDGTHAELTARSPLYRELLSGEMSDDGEPPDDPREWRAVTESRTRRGAGRRRRLGRPVRGDAARADAGARTRRSAAGVQPMAAGGTSSPRLRRPSCSRRSRRSPRSGTLPTSTSRSRRRLEQGLFSFGAFLGRSRRFFAIGATFVLLDAAAGLVGPLLTGTLVAHGIRVHHLGVVWGLASLYAAIQLVDWGFMWAETFTTGRTSERLLFALRAKIFAHLQRLGIDFYEREMTGRILTRMTSDVDALATLLQSGLVNALVNFAGFFGVSAILVVLEPRLALSSVLTVDAVPRHRHRQVYQRVVLPVHLRPPARADRRGQRRPPGARVGGTGDPGIPPRVRTAHPRLSSPGLVEGYPRDRVSARNGSRPPTSASPSSSATSECSSPSPSGPIEVSGRDAR